MINKTFEEFIDRYLYKVIKQKDLSWDTALFKCSYSHASFISARKTDSSWWYNLYTSLVYNDIQNEIFGSLL